MHFLNIFIIYQRFHCTRHYTYTVFFLVFKQKQIINSLLSEKPEDRPDASAVKEKLEEWTQIFSTQKASRQENQTV